MTPVMNTGLGQARVTGMKLRAELNGPSAATGAFPYPHRTCAEWEEHPHGFGLFITREMTDDERIDDAVCGSAALRDAIRAEASMPEWYPER